MEKRLTMGFLNIIKWLVAGIFVLLAVLSKEYVLLVLLVGPAMIDVFTIVTLMDEKEKI